MPVTVIVQKNKMRVSFIDLLDPLDFLAEFTQHIPPQGLAPDPLLRLILEQGPLPEVPGPDEGGRFHRAAAGGRLREDSPPLRAMESVDASRPAAARRLGL